MARPFLRRHAKARWFLGASGLVAACTLGLLFAVSVVGGTGAAKASAERATAYSTVLAYSYSGFRSVHLDMSLHSDGPGTWYVEWGPTTAYGSTSYVNSFTDDHLLANAYTGITGLDAGTTYHVRIVATSGGTTWYSNDVVASTLPKSAPVIEFNPNYHPILDPYGHDFYVQVGINTKGYDTTWWAVAGGDLSNPFTSTSQVITAYDYDSLGFGGGMDGYVYLTGPLPPVVYLQVRARNVNGTSESETLTYTTATITTTTTATTTTTPPIQDEQRPSIGSTSLPTAHIGEPYSVSLPLTHGSPPYIVKLNGNDAVMPDGLQLSPDGVVSGTPTSPGTYLINIKVFDQMYSQTSGGPAAVFTLTINVADPPVTTSTSRTTPSTTTTSSTSSTTTPTTVGHSVLLAKRIKTSGCKRATLPDRRCSPGAYYSGLTKAVLCSPTFRAATIRGVPQSEKSAVEREYGMPVRAYGRTIEIDQIVSLELGGSNDIANLFPEPGSGKANYHVKDKLENKLHSLVCAGTMTLQAARTGIARNWQVLYTTVYGVSP